ncbi:MAG: hypothetical protein V3W33_00070 [Gammaproteobacteria bacterium]
MAWASVANWANKRVKPSSKAVPAKYRHLPVFNAPSHQDTPSLGIRA